MSSYLYYCSKCNKLYKVREQGRNIKCSKCFELAQDMNISSEEYEKLDTKLRQTLKETFSKSTTAPFYNEGVSNDKNIPDDSEIECPQCKKKIEAKFKYCPECGFNLKNQAQNKTSEPIEEVPYMMYVCPECKKIYKVKGNDKRIKCSKCSNIYLSDMKVNIDEWYELSNDEKISTIKRVKEQDKNNLDFKKTKNNAIFKKGIDLQNFSSIKFSGNKGIAREALEIEYLFEVLKYNEKERKSTVYRKYVKDSIMILNYCNVLTPIKELDGYGENSMRTTAICVRLHKAGLMERQHKNLEVYFQTLPIYYENLSYIEKEALTKDSDEIENELRKKHKRPDISFDSSKILGSKEYTIKYFQKIVSLETSLYSIKKRYNELSKTLIMRVAEGVEDIKKGESKIVDTINRIKSEMVYIVSMMDKTIDAIYELYSYGCIYGKYRSYIVVSTFCDYFLSGRCDKLDGPDGAYNMYEQEARADKIISQLDQVLTSLEKIKDNQFYIYNEIQTSNEQLELINGQLLFNNFTQVVQINQLDEVIYNSKQTALNTKVTAYYAKKNAELTDALGFLTAFK